MILLPQETTTSALGRVVENPGAYAAILVPTVFMLFGIFFVIAFVLASQRGEPPRFERNWGGFGGALGGWRMSRSLSYLLAAIVFLSLFTFSALSLVPEVEARAEQPAQDTATTPRQPDPAQQQNGASGPDSTGAPDSTGTQQGATNPT